MPCFVVIKNAKILVETRFWSWTSFCHNAIRQCGSSSKLINVLEEVINHARKLVCVATREKVKQKQLCLFSWKHLFNIGQIHQLYVPICYMMLFYLTYSMVLAETDGVESVSNFSCIIIAIVLYIRKYYVTIWYTTPRIGKYHITYRSLKSYNNFFVILINLIKTEYRIHIVWI